MGLCTLLVEVAVDQHYRLLEMLAGDNRQAGSMIVEERANREKPLSVSFSIVGAIATLRCGEKEGRGAEARTWQPRLPSVL